MPYTLIMNAGLLRKLLGRQNTWKGYELAQYMSKNLQQDRKQYIKYFTPSLTDKDD